MFRVESLLSARLFMQPQVTGERIFFISNLSGHLSLYAMDTGGSVPEPLLPPQLALQNPHLVGGYSFCVFPGLGKILVMLDADGDENYQPMLIPLEGGYPEPAFEGKLANQRVHLTLRYPNEGMVYMTGESRESDQQTAYQGNLANGELLELAAGAYLGGAYGASPDHKRAIVVDGYTMGDEVLYEWVSGQAERSLVFGVPLEKRLEGQAVPLTGFGSPHYTQNCTSLLFTTALFTDSYGPAVLELDGSMEPRAVVVSGEAHSGVGEMVGLDHLKADQYLVTYNIDGSSWVYEARFDAPGSELHLERVLVGKGPLAGGVLESISYDSDEDRFALAFSTATSPTQIYTIEGPARDRLVRHTREKVLGIPDEQLSSGEDASFISFDGTRVSARLYMPAEQLGFQGPRPVVYYVHGGPQGQERPDFAWFSMPLIQFLTLYGFAVFVPNARGSTGYGLNYTKQVDRDWGGQDRLDHVHALQVLATDPRLDVRRAGVVGRSYGGYMTLTLAARHPELWSAAVDMFGPFDLITFLERIPPTWKPYFKMALGDVDTDRAFLEERSPRTHIDQITCPLLVIQGKNDPRVVERESHDLVEHLRAQGKQVEYLMFENEGHDVLKFENRVRCYNAITDFFTTTLKP